MDYERALALVQGADDETLAKLREKVSAYKGDRKFTPSPGPQTEAYFCLADELLYGGQAGAGKSGLLCGLALTQHKRSLLMRRNGADLQGGGGLIEDVLRMYGSRDGFNGSSPPTLRTGDDRIITFGGATNVGDEQKFQGRPRDFFGADEAVQFHESQVDYLKGWVRSEDVSQQCRTILATNPPLDSTGLWIIRRYRPWLDLTHHNPASPGELRWFVRAPDGEEVEVDGPDPVEMGGHTLYPSSRTFIPGRLSDNPYLADTGYDKRLDALPEPLRSAVRDGNFMAARGDAEFQVIPSAWIREAQARWKPDPPNAPMSSMGVDIAQGGPDHTVLAPRHDWWFAPLISKPGEETPTGTEVAGMVVMHRRNNCTVIVDMGGGYGGSTSEHLAGNGIDVTKFNGANASDRRTLDQSLGFVNKRAEAWWRFREALDPSQQGGSAIALPDDTELVSDLTSPTYKITPRGIQIEAKVDIKARTGRSPDKGDAVVMAWTEGPTHLTHGNIWRDFARPGGALPKVQMGYQSRRRR